MKNKIVSKDTYYICQFCGKSSRKKEWINNKCVYCKKEYDPILAQEGDD